MGNMTFTTDLAMRRIERIQHLLRREDMTIHDISAGIHLSYRWAAAYVGHLHASGAIHITGYRKSMRADGTFIHVALYAWGKASDATKPAPLTDSERHQRYLQHPELGEFRKERKRAWGRKPRRDWAAFWIPTREAQQ